MMSFGKRLKATRENKGFNKSELAEAIGIHYSQLGRYERDESTPTADTLKRLANALGVSADYLMNGTAKEMAEDSFKDKNLMNLFNRISGLGVEDKKVVTSLIDAYLFKQEMKKQLAH
jgi:transcriptional regulator with XRE-family HTH domain